MAEEEFEALRQFVSANSRVCPMPQQWARLYGMLPGTRQLDSGGFEPPLPLILAGWDTPALWKALRLLDHIEWAYAHGALNVVDTFLRSLPEEQWFHIGE